jgi:hypothetical protein
LWKVPTYTDFAAFSIIGKINLLTPEKIVDTVVSTKINDKLESKTFRFHPGESQIKA